MAVMKQKSRLKRVAILKLVFLLLIKANRLRCFFAHAPPFDISLHAGLTIPPAKLSPPYGLGAFIETDLTYQINKNLDAEALLGYYGFSGGFNILGASLLAGYRIDPTPGLYLRPAVGIGLFKPKGQASSIGYTARVELVKNLNSHLDGTLHIGYFNIPGPKYPFLTLGVGVKYHF